MAAIAKMSRTSLESTVTHEDDFFDFGDPEVLPVEISSGTFLYLKEPSAEELMEIYKISEDKKVSEIEATLQTICILHSPTEGQRKLTLKDAKKLRPRQLRLFGKAIDQLLGMNDSKEEGE